MTIEPLLILIVISGLVQPISTTDNEDDLEQPYETPEELIEVAIVILSSLLFLLSLSAYLTTRFKRLIFAVGAFGLFSLYSIVDYLEDLVPFFDAPYLDIIWSSIILAILVLFFLAITRRK
jgi:hypothetical protein